MRYVSFLLIALLWAPSAVAQDEVSCPADSLSLSDASFAQSAASAPASPPAADELTAAEERVQQIISRDGVHVIHFWAPWCPNSKNELADGWYDVVEQHDDVTFTFVTIWNNGEDGASTLDRYAIPDRVVELTQPDFGPSKNNEANRRKEFLDLPVTWIPSTWIFHNNGELAYALNYGEMDMETISRLIDMTQQDW